MAKYNVASLKEAVVTTCPRCTKPQIATAIAVSLAENPGMDSDTNSPPNRDGSIDRGPFQINSHAHAEVPDSCAHDLACSAQAAYKISNGYKNWTPWTTYKSGAYKAHLDAVDTPLGGDSGAFGTGVGSPTNLPNPLKGIDLLATAVEKFVEGLFSSSLWFRVGKVVVGLFLGAAGIIILIRKAGLTPPVLPIPV